jgi:GT2 family glycosyltransferase
MPSPTYLAIPNYNMATQLERLLPTVVNRGYEHVYIFDDHSTDNSEQVVSTFQTQGVSFVGSTENKGAASMRNRILEYQQKGIVHFLDSDVTLEGSGNVTNSIRDAFERHPEAGAIGFRVLNPDNSQYDWNFGPKRKLFDGLTWRSLDWYEQTENNICKRVLRHLFKQRWDNFWTYTHPESAEHEQQVGAAVECNLAVRLEDFSRVNGFDGTLRFHEIHSLALKFNSVDRTVWYVPELPVLKHSEVDVRTNRKQEMHRAQLLLDFKRLTGQYKIP